MKTRNLRFSLISGLIIAVINFLLLIIGVRLLLSNDLLLQNIIAYVILSLILGGITAALLYFNLKMAVIIFQAGMIIGFFNLYAMFIKDSGGWGDLAGFMSYLAWLIIGIISGLLVQLILLLYQKGKRK